MAKKIESFSPEDVCDYLKRQLPSMDKNIFEKILEHKIDGEVFLSLNDEYLREIAPLLGDRLKLKRAVNSALISCSTPLSSYSIASSPASVSTPLMPLSTVNDADNSKSYGAHVINEIAAEMELDVEDMKENINGDHDIQSLDVTDSDIQCMEGESSVKSFSSEAKLSVSDHNSVSNAPASSQLTEFDKSYAEKLAIPTRFSAETTACIKSGVLTKRSRDEIVNSLATLMLVHTSRPTPEDLTMVSRRLMEKYPILKDNVDGGYNSWRAKLRMKFKNLRRPARAKKSGITVHPPLKKFKTDDDDATSSIAVTSSDSAVYERHLEYLQRSFNSKKWSVLSMVTLLQETAEQRRSWITNENPPVKLILEKFPCLADPKVMIKEFCHLTSVTEEEIKDRWSQITKQLFKYVPMEEKKSVKNLLKQYNSIESNNEDRDTVYALYLLAAILNRGKDKGSLLTVFEGESIDVGEAIHSIEINSPCIVAFGATLDSPSDVKVIIEGDNILPMPSMSIALDYCFSSYYVFNISFPNDCRPLMLFLEKYIYGLKPSRKLPLSVNVLIDNLQKVK